jgi:hypothetical protein
MKRFLWLALAIVAGVIGLAVGSALHLSKNVDAGLGALAIFVASFPFMKPWMPQVKFRSWLIGATVFPLWMVVLYLLGLLKLRD